MIRFSLVMIGFLLIRMDLSAMSEDSTQEKLKLLQNKFSLEDPLVSMRKKCEFPIQEIPDRTPNVLIFASFSMSDSVWVALSQELEKVNGSFVIQGLPDNSFKELVSKIYHLRQLGVSADIQLYPQLFDQYTIKKVPTFVVVEANRWDQLSGNISLESALIEMKHKGECAIVASLLDKLQGESQ
jgi:conjugal transfer pilus assembly protein TrbC